MQLNVELIWTGLGQVMRPENNIFSETPSMLFSFEIFWYSYIKMSTLLFGPVCIPICVMIRFGNKEHLSNYMKVLYQNA